MKILASPLLIVSLLTGCTLSPAGLERAALPPAVQGSNDAQGSPISIPGAGMGVDAGNPSPASTAKP
jgi:hypothetical protein